MTFPGMPRRLLFKARRFTAQARASFNYGISRPGWWPKTYRWYWGPSNPYDGKRVEFRVEGHNYVFEPSAFGRFRGHQCIGYLPASRGEIAKYLEIDGHPVEHAGALAATSRLEGGFDSIQTYDRARFSWGFIQLAASGGLINALRRLKVQFPREYADCFALRGITVDEEGLTIEYRGKSYKGNRALNELHDNPHCWKVFVLASRVPAVRHMQVRHAYENYFQGITRLYLPEYGMTLGDLVGGTPWGRAVLFDRAVHGGIAYAARLFKMAISTVTGKSLPEPEVVLSQARRLDSINSSRWSALETAMGDQ